MHLKIKQGHLTGQDSVHECQYQVMKTDMYDWCELCEIKPPFGMPENIAFSFVLFFVYCFFVFGHGHKYQTQLCISTKLKKFLWITFVYLNFRHWNFPHRRKPWLRKYLLQYRIWIFIQGRLMLKNNSVYFLAV